MEGELAGDDYRRRGLAATRRCRPPVRARARSSVRPASAAAGGAAQRLRAPAAATARARHDEEEQDDDDRHLDLARRICSRRSNAKSSASIRRRSWPPPTACRAGSRSRAPSAPPSGNAPARVGGLGRFADQRTERRGVADRVAGDDAANASRSAADAAARCRRSTRRARKKAQAAERDDDQQPPPELRGCRPRLRRRTDLPERRTKSAAADDADDAGRAERRATRVFRHGAII